MAQNALFVFNGDSMCFIHVLLNALDMQKRGDDVKVILEGASVKLLPELVKPGNPLNALWKKSLEAGVIDGVCKACAQKLGTLDAAVEQKVPLLEDLSGHASMAGYQKKGFVIITF